MSKPSPTKKEMGVLSQFPDLIVFLGNENGCGFFLEAANMERLKKGIAAVLKQKPELREVFRRAVNEASGIIIPN